MRTFAILSALAVTAVAISFVKGPESGLEVGATVPAYHPRHATGANAGSDACPPCTYGARPAVQVWVNGDTPENVGKIAKNLETAMSTYSAKEFKSWVVFMASCVGEDNKCDGMDAKLKDLAKANSLEKVGLVYLDPTNAGTKLYKVNAAPEVKNTVFVYVKKKVVAKFVNLEANEAGLAELNKAIAAAAH
jgi:hypothetical protein